MKAMVNEAFDREKKAVRTNLEDYLNLRRYTGAIKPSFDFILLPLDIPESFLNHPVIQQLEFLAIDMIAVANVRLIYVLR